MEVLFQVVDIPRIGRGADDQRGGRVTRCGREHGMHAVGEPILLTHAHTQPRRERIRPEDEVAHAQGREVRIGFLEGEGGAGREDGVGLVRRSDVLCRGRQVGPDLAIQAVDWHLGLPVVENFADPARCRHWIEVADDGQLAFGVPSWVRYSSTTCGSVTALSRCIFSLAVGT